MSSTTPHLPQAPRRPRPHELATPSSMSPVFISMTLMDAYAKTSRLELVLQVLGKMPSRNVVSRTMLIASMDAGEGWTAALHALSSSVAHDSHACTVALTAMSSSSSKKSIFFGTHGIEHTCASPSCPGGSILNHVLGYSSYHCPVLWCLKSILDIGEHLSPGAYRTNVPIAYKALWVPVKIHSVKSLNHSAISDACGTVRRDCLSLPVLFDVSMSYEV
ncbi:hypothetical protein Zm00014a_038264 [Zea mays]|uniref:Pentatricopeptide repeat-containing protein n=1 Tax=Zea mays TaxID=4577 RepID=A0A3L6DWF2_MAIZE|nr:hypothetical protein Zm00014a_038264 [Zea mays]